jgi:hypothetical protein
MFQGEGPFSEFGPSSFVFDWQQIADIQLTWELFRGVAEDYI